MSGAHIASHDLTCVLSNETTYPTQNSIVRNIREYNYLMVAMKERIMNTLMLMLLSASAPAWKINSIKRHVTFQRIWADGEADQAEVYQQTHELLTRYNISDTY